MKLSVHDSDKFLCSSLCIIFKFAFVTYARVVLMHFIMLVRRFPGCIKLLQPSRDCSTTLLHVTGLSRSYWFIPIGPFPYWLASTARPVVVCTSSNESVAASWGSQANSGCRYTFRKAVGTGKCQP
jgi:hypothetical protein